MNIQANIMCRTFLIVCCLLLLVSCSSNNSTPETNRPADTASADNTPSPVTTSPDIEPVPDAPIKDIVWGLAFYQTAAGEQFEAAFVPPYSMEILSEQSSAIVRFRAALQCGQVSGDYRLEGRTLTLIDVQDQSATFGCTPQPTPTGDARTDAFIIDFFVGNNTYDIDTADNQLSLTSSNGATARFLTFNAGVVAFRTLAQSFEGGPAFTDTLSEAGLHLRQFKSYTDAQTASKDFALLNTTNNPVWTDAAAVLQDEGGTLITLYPGLQTSSGAISTSVVKAEVEAGQLIVSLRTTNDYGCYADAAFGAPFSIVHINAQAPEVVFKEAIVPCGHLDDSPNADVRDISVDFPQGTNNALITWTAPDGANDDVRYDVIQQNSEQGVDIYDGVDVPGYETDDLVPGLIYTYRIQAVGGEVDAGSSRLSGGNVIAIILDAPSALFKGRVQRSDLEARARALSGAGAIDCGDAPTPPGNSLEETNGALSCAQNALANGDAFFRLWTFTASEGESVRALAGDRDGNAWLLDFNAPDVNIGNPFTPDLPFGGYLTGKRCAVPLLDERSGRVVCG